MKRLIGNCPRAATALAVLASLAGSMLRAEESSSPPDDTPESLVQAALATELQGPSEVRKTLLDRALRLDPNYAPARWHSGYVRWSDSWTNIEDVPKLAAADPQLAAYRAKREGLVDTADNQRELARWCRKNKLTDEARIHWAKVLEFDPQDAEALSALGLQLYEGRLLTRAQIDEEKKQAGERLKALRHWQPKVVKWRKAIEHGSAGERAEALRQLSELNDPAAIPALEANIRLREDSTRISDCDKAIVATLGRITVPESSQALARLAIFSVSEELRSAAINGLQGHSLYSFAPWLIAMLPTQGTLKTRHEFFMLVDGTVIREHELYLEDALGNTLARRQLVDVDHPLQGSRVRGLAVFRIRAAAREAQAADAQLSAQQAFVDRVHDVLVAATGLREEKAREPWFEQLARHYDTYLPPEFPTPGAMEFTTTLQVRATPSCFPAGTTIHTIAGRKPIESISPGDRVLAQDVRTGELRYTTVQACTLRPASPMVVIDAGGETMRATRGHPFWVNGQGWRMAKQLKQGDFLHSLRGAAPIDSIGEAPPAEAYNLVLSDLNTYFVGDTGALVHDNLWFTETLIQVPGLLANKQP